MTTKRHSPRDPCGFCATFGYYLPWSMIVVGGLVGAIPALSMFERSSSYLLATGLLLLGGSAILNHFKKMNIPRL